MPLIIFIAYNCIHQNLAFTIMTKHKISSQKKKKKPTFLWKLGALSSTTTGMPLPHQSWDFKYFSISRRVRNSMILAVVDQMGDSKPLIQSF